MRDFLGANGSPPLCVVALFRPPAARAGVLEPLQKWVCRVLSIMSSLTFFNPGAPPIFSMALIRLRLPEGAEKRHYA